MEKVIETTIKSPGEPRNRNNFWLDDFNGGILKYWNGYMWVPIAGSNPGPSSDIVGEIVGTA